MAGIPSPPWPSCQRGLPKNIVVLPFCHAPILGKEGWPARMGGRTRVWGLPQSRDWCSYLSWARADKKDRLFRP